jgi:hypothetical protein
MRDAPDDAARPQRLAALTRGNGDGGDAEPLEGEPRARTAGGELAPTALHRPADARLLLGEELDSGEIAARRDHDNAVGHEALDQNLTPRERCGEVARPAHHSAYAGAGKRASPPRNAPVVHGASRDAEVAVPTYHTIGRTRDD